VWLLESIGWDGGWVHPAYDFPCAYLGDAHLPCADCTDGIIELSFERKWDVLG